MPWNENGGSGPWGQGPRGPKQQGPGQPPDLEELIRQFQNRLKGVAPGGKGVGAIVMIALVVVGALWAFTGFYRVRDSEMGVVLTFGQFTTLKTPGLGWHWPAPIQTVEPVNVGELRRTDIGIAVSQRGGERDVPEESLMLTGDENIIDLDFRVNWRVDTARVQDFLFNIRDIDQNEGTVKAVAESAMREVVGRNRSDFVRAVGRAEVAREVGDLIQSTLDEYGAGINVEEVVITQAEPPPQVIDAFRDVQAAAADRQTRIEEARRYANQRIQGAEGQASRIRAEAEGYGRSVVAEAAGEGRRFLAIYEQYRQAPDVTRQRMYLETMERVLADKDKVIIDSQVGGPGGVVPYLPLDRLSRPPSDQSGGSGQSGTGGRQ